MRENKMDLQLFASSRELTETLDTLYTTTWQLMRETAIDNIFRATPFWYYMQERDRTRPESGGRWIGIPIEHDTHDDSIKWMSRKQDLETEVNAADKELLTTAYYKWTYLSVSVMRVWQDEMQNRGKSQIMRIVDQKLSNAEKTLTKNLESELFNDATDDDKLHGLRHLVSDDAANPPGSGDYDDKVGDIDPSDHSFWENQSDNMTGLNPATHLVPRMRTIFNDCSEGDDTPNLIACDQGTYELYEDETLEFMKIVNRREGDASFDEIYFKGQPMIWSSSAPEEKMYFLNTDYLEWVYDPDINFEMTPWKDAKEDLERVAQILVAGQLVTSNRRMQGVLYNIND